MSDDKPTKSKKGKNAKRNSRVSDPKQSLKLTLADKPDSPKADANVSEVFDDLELANVEVPAGVASVPPGGTGEVTTLVQPAASRAAVSMEDIKSMFSGMLAEHLQVAKKIGVRYPTSSSPPFQYWRTTLD
jgi:hypothetical protein